MPSKKKPAASAGNRAENAIARRAREMAERIDRLGDDVIASFSAADPEKRVARLRKIGIEIELGMLPVIGWVERRRPPETAELLKCRLMHVLDEFLACAGYDIPEYAGGSVGPASQSDSPSEGARRTATMHVMAKLFAALLCDWADDIQAEDAPRRAGSTGNKKSTSKGDARAKITSGFTQHHKYQDESCLNWEPVAGNKLARRVGVAPSSASEFFKKHFGSHTNYRAACSCDSGRASLVAVLKKINDDYSTAHLFGRTPPGEGGRAEDD